MMDMGFFSSSFFLLKKKKCLLWSWNKDKLPLYDVQHSFVVFCLLNLVELNFYFLFVWICLPVGQVGLWIRKVGHLAILLLL